MVVVQERILVVGIVEGTGVRFGGLGILDMEVQERIGVVLQVMVVILKDCKAA